MGNASMTPAGPTTVLTEGPVTSTLGRLNKRRDSEDSEDDSWQLSRKQKLILKRTWILLNNNLNVLGMTTFIKMFETHPEALKHMIPKLTAGKENNSIKQKDSSNRTEDGVVSLDPWHSEKLREHAQRIMSTVSQVIGLLDKDEQEIENMLIRLGRKHCGFGVHGDILALMGPHFIAAIYPTLKDHWNDELQKAWNSLFTYLIHFMQIGYDQALLAKVKPTWIGYFD